MRATKQLEQIASLLEYNALSPDVQEGYADTVRLCIKLIQHVNAYTHCDNNGQDNEIDYTYTDLANTIYEINSIK